MNVNEMCIAQSDISLVSNEFDVMDEILSLNGASVLELGCGKAEKTRFVAQKAASVLALEVDKIQLAQNKIITDIPNVRFEYGGAEKIPSIASNFDFVLMFKSLHHVPINLMDQAFSEICRVLKPGGIAYISEPIYAGGFNEIMRLFHDEKVMRESAFAAVERVISSGRLKLLGQKFFLQPMHFESFHQFDARVLNVTHSEHKLSPELYEEVRLNFNKHMTPKGVDFYIPIRVDLLINE